MDNSSQKKITQRQAQETFARLASKIFAQVEIAANSQKSEVARADALNRLERARVALE